MKKLWSTFYSVLGDPASDLSDEHTADGFATCFQDKVDAVRNSRTVVT